jgi:hypothetical protein
MVPLLQLTWSGQAPPYGGSLKYVSTAHHNITEGVIKSLVGLLWPDMVRASPPLRSIKKHIFKNSVGFRHKCACDGS